MLRVLSLSSAGVLVALLSASASASPIRYTTAGSLIEGAPFPGLHFEGTSGTFDPGSAFSLGRFVIDAPKPGSSTTYENVGFVIALKTPDFDQAVPASPGIAVYPTTIESSVLIRGHLSGVISPGAPGLVAIYDSVQLGGLGPHPAGHVQRFSFPVPVSDVKLPADQLLVIPTDGWADSKSLLKEVNVQVAPEPATFAMWGLFGIALTAARRRVAGVTVLRNPGKGSA